MPANITQIEGATQIDFYLGNYTSANIISSMEALKLKLATDTNKLMYKNASGTTFTIPMEFGTAAGTICQGNDSRLSDSRAPTAHTLDGAFHTVSGLTTGHFLKATGATTFAFAAHGLTYSDVGAAASSHTHAHNDTTSKQGGTTNEYYHLTSAQVSALHAAVTLATDHGLALTGQQIAMGTPSTITAATTNSVSTTTHTHAITGFSETSHTHNYAPVLSLTQYRIPLAATTTTLGDGPFLCASNQSTVWLDADSRTLCFGGTITDYQIKFDGTNAVHTIDSGAISFALETDRNMLIKYDTNLTLSAQNDLGNPEKLRYYAEDHIFYVGTTSGNIDEKMRIVSTGSVGIGTSNPALSGGKLTIHTADAGYVAIEPSGTVANGISCGLRLHGATGETDRYAGIFCVNYASTIYNGMSFWTTYNAASAERMRITDAGLVGIGVTAPSTRIHAKVEDAYNESVINVLTLTHTTTGTPVDGSIGTGINFEVEQAGHVSYDAVSIWATTEGFSVGDDSFTWGKIYTRPYSGGLTHGMTSIAPTSCPVRISSYTATARGGAEFWGLSAGDYNGATVYGVIGAADPTDSVAAVTLDGSKRNGTTNQALGNAETVLTVTNYYTVLATMLGNGNFGLGRVPTYKLDVNGTTRFSSTVSVLADSTKLVFGADSDSSIMDNNTNMVFTRETAGGFQFTTGAVDIKVNTDRHLVSKYDSQVALSSQNDAGNPESLRIYADTLKLYTGTPAAANLSERLTITNGGYVGVNTTTPNTAAGQFVVRTAAAGYAAIEPPIGDITSGISCGLRLSGRGNETDRYAGIFCYNGTANNVNSLLFYTTASGGSPSEKMRLTSGGDLGIGTTAPASLLEVQGGLTTTGAVLSLGTKETTVDSGDNLGRINFYAPLEASGGDALLVGASIVAQATASFTSSVNSTALLFQTGASETAQTQMWLDSVGNLGLGIAPTAAVTYRVLALNGTGSYSGYISLLSDGTEWAALGAWSGGIVLNSVGARYIQMWTNGSERLSISSAGVVTATSYILQQGIFAGIHAHDASAAQSITNGTTYTKLTCFTDNDESANCTADATNDKITITIPGRYLVSFNITGLSGTNALVWRFTVFNAGTEQNNIHAGVRTQTTLDEFSLSASGFVDVVSVPADIDLRARHSRASAADVTVEYANLSCVYVGAT